MLAVIHNERFIDMSPEHIHATLLDEGVYLCSVRTMYRLLRQRGETMPRRRQRQHPPYQRPELTATAPNQVWTWDITLLRGPHRGIYYRLYVILDLFSRFVVGWMLAHTENGKLAARVLRDACDKQKIDQADLTIHADRGSSMKSKPVALLLADLGVTKTHSRPHTSDDNPFSEANFKTLKYRPGFPERFGAQEDARHHCADFFDWYNTDHHHSKTAETRQHFQ